MKDCKKAAYSPSPSAAVRCGVPDELACGLAHVLGPERDEPVQALPLHRLHEPLCLGVHVRGLTLMSLLAASELRPSRDWVMSRATLSSLWVVFEDGYTRS